MNVLDHSNRITIQCNLDEPNKKYEIAHLQRTNKTKIEPCTHIQSHDF